MDEIRPKTDRIGRKLYSVEERDRLMAECEVSGRTRKDFAREHGLNYPTLIYWFTHYGKKGQRGCRGGGGVRFKPLDTKPLFSLSERKSDTMVEILCGSITVRLYRDRG